MCGPEDSQLPGSGQQDIGEALWLPDVDYVGGWRQATDSGAELLASLDSAGLDADGSTVQARSAADGSGLVQLLMPVPVARELARLLRDAAAGRRARRPAS